MARLTHIDEVCRKRVAELSGGDPELAYRIARQASHDARSFEAEDRERAAKAARVFSKGIVAEAGGKTISAKDAEALIKAIRKHTRSAHEWKRFSKAYKLYADEIADARNKEVRS